MRAWAQPQGVDTDELDGLTLTHAGGDGDPMWWLNLRASNTEPLLRLNVEAADAATMARVRDEVLAIVRGLNPTTSATTHPAGTGCRVLTASGPRRP